MIDNISKARIGEYIQENQDPDSPFNENYICKATREACTALNNYLVSKYKSNQELFDYLIAENELTSSSHYLNNFDPDLDEGFYSRFEVLEEMLGKNFIKLMAGSICGDGIGMFDVLESDCPDLNFLV